MRSVLLTQPQARSERQAEALSTQGIDTLIWPLMRIAPLLSSAPSLNDTDAILVTSANALVVFAKKSGRRDVPVLCVGEATAAQARALGFKDVQSADGDGVALAKLAKARDAKSYLYLRAQDISVDLAALIGTDRVTEVITYAAKAAGPPSEDITAAFKTGRIGLVTVWSERAAQVLTDHLRKFPDWQMDKTDVLAISAKVAKRLENAPFHRQLTPSDATRTAMLDQICRWFHE